MLFLAGPAILHCALSPILFIAMGRNAVIVGFNSYSICYTVGHFLIAFGIALCVVRTVDLKGVWD